MRFLADENFPRAAVDELIARDHDVVWVRVAGAGARDPDVLLWAEREDRILLTFDKDFGELARAFPLSPACGIVLFRLAMAPPGKVGRHLADLIEARDDWRGHFSVVEPGRIRMRPLG
jgi:predicted nuclease of predicted toxin-antitoxin system